MHRVSLPIAALAAVLSTAVANGAPMLHIVPPSGAVYVGELVSLDIVLDRDGSAVGAYDIDIGYDNGFLQFESASFGVSLGAPLDSIATALSFGSFVEIAEVSLLDAATLLAEPGSITLATLEFRALSSGDTQLVGIVDALSDGDGLPLQAVVHTARFMVSPHSSVPAPAHGWLVIAGAIGLITQWRRRGRRREWSVRRSWFGYRRMEALVR